MKKTILTIVGILALTSTNAQDKWIAFNDKGKVHALAKDINDKMFLSVHNKNEELSIYFDLGNGKGLKKQNNDNGVYVASFLFDNNKEPLNALLLENSRLERFNVNKDYTKKNESTFSLLLFLMQTKNNMSVKFQYWNTVKGVKIKTALFTVKYKLNGSTKAITKVTDEAIKRNYKHFFGKRD